MEDTGGIEARWRELATRALKGGPLEGLTRRCRDGLPLPPFHASADPIYSARPAAGRWSVVQRVNDDAAAASQALLDLHNGADALEIVFASGAHPGGLTSSDLGALDGALEGVHFNHCALHLRGGGIGGFALVLALAARRNTPPLALHGGVDPFGELFAIGESAGAAEAGAALHGAARSGFAGTAVLADGRPVAEAGATPAEELAFSCASLVAALRAAEAQGVAAPDALPRIAIGLSADQDQFVTIAKVRAARRLHAQIARSCGVDGAVAQLHVATSQRMLSARDPHTNLVRLTVAAFAAGVGGADALFVAPFDGSGSPFARRMARNIQSLLLEEAHVDALADPAAGSGAIEALTEALAQAAWTLFQAFEGDHEARIASGDWRERVMKSAAEEEKRVADGASAIIGVTKHAPETPAPARSSPAPPQARARRGDGAPLPTLIERALAGTTLAELSPAATVRAPATPPQRLAARFEEAADGA